MNSQNDDVIYGKKSIYTIFKNDRLGKGGVGSVYRGKDLDGNEVAIKIISIETKSQKKQLLIEGKNLRKLRKNCELNVVCIKEIIRANSTGYIVTNIIKGVNLLEIKIQNLEHLISVFKYIVSVLKYIHLNDIMHLDLKPDNIMYSGDEKNFNIKFIDFGLSCNLYNGECDNIIGQIGGRNYRDPEMFRKSIEYTKNDEKINIDEKIDVYAIGVILYEMFMFFITNNKFQYVNISSDVPNMNDFCIVKTAYQNALSFNISFYNNEKFVKINNILLGCMTLLRKDRYNSEELYEKINQI